MGILLVNSFRNLEVLLKDTKHIKSEIQKKKEKERAIFLSRNRGKRYKRLKKKKKGYAI